jgi:hypothetical protein
MLDELQLYGIDGLFHNLVKKSSVFNGRYGVLLKGGDLNLNNVLSGIEFPKETYPGVFCLPPVSVIKEATVQQAPWECFYFRLFFLCTTEYTGDNQFKFRDPSTNTSMHKVNIDWSDMKGLCLSFMNALETLQKLPALRNSFRLGQKDEWKIFRLSKLQNANLSGVMIQFEAQIAVSCEFTDINIDGIDTLLPTHFH